MNEQNLIANSERTPSERQEIARKGGIASGEARRQSKLAKQIAIDILNGQTIKHPDGREITLKEAMIEKLLKQTINSPKAKDVDFILALIGEEVERKTTHVVEGVSITAEDKARFEEAFGMNIHKGSE